MKNKALYCSRKATSLLKYYGEELKNNPKFEFIIYDGDDDNTYKTLCSFNIKVYWFHRKSEERDTSIKFSLDLSNFILKTCSQNQIDYLICIGDSVLKGDLLSIYENRIINIHPSLLPSFKGLQAIDQALETNVRLLGITAHFIDEGIDTGNIILQGYIHRADYKDYDSVLCLLKPIMDRILYFIDNNLLITHEDKSVSFLMNEEELLIHHKPAN